MNSNNWMERAKDGAMVEWVNDALVIIKASEMLVAPRISEYFLKF